MTLVQLEYVLAVAESKNFTIAAEKVFVTQPTLSMQIQKLEAELGIDIFDRSTHPIKVTSIGRKVIEQIKVILSETKKMKLLVTEQKETIEGEFVVGVIPTIIPTLVPIFYKAFINKFPKAKLKIVELKTAEILEQLKNDKIDFGIAVTPINNDEYVEEVLFYEPMVAYVPSGHRLSDKKELSEDDLDTKDLLILEEGHCFRNNVLSICKNYSNDSKIAVESGSFDTLIKLANDGFGMTILPALQAKDLEGSKISENIRGFKKPVPTREVSLIYYHTQLRMGFVRELKNLIQSLVRGMIFLEGGNRTFPQLSIKK